MLSIERQSGVGATGTRSGSGSNLDDVRQWFNHIYRVQGRDYLRAPEAYDIFPELLAVEPQRRLLDVACGPGQLLSRLERRGVEGFGIDLSETALGLLDESSHAFAVQQADASRLPYRDESFDYITCIGALERMPRVEEVLGELSRVSRKRARLCFMVRNSTTIGWRLIRSFGLINRKGHQGAASLEEWTGIFEKAGFRVTRVVSDQWRRMFVERVLKRLGFKPRFDRVKRDVIPLRYANEFIFVCDRAPAPPPSNRTASLARFYDVLSRFEYWRTRLKSGRSTNLATLTMHKGLSPAKDSNDGPEAGPKGLDDWFSRRVARARPKDVLDIGCGFGATLARIHARCGARCRGLTLSPYQQSVAKRTAEGSRSDALTVEVADFEHQLLDEYDAVISLETLVYASDLSGALLRLSRRLRPGGRVFVLEDMSRGSSSGADNDLEKYRQLWELREVYSRQAFEDAFRDAGLQIVEHIDLTERVLTSPVAQIQKKIRLRKWFHHLAWWRPLATISAAFLGGLHLEKMYAQGEMGYHFFELRGSEDVSRNSR